VTPRQFLSGICKPNVDDLVAEATSVRQAWNAVVSLLHFADFLAAARAVNLPSIRSEFHTDYPKFKLIEDIANANKHFVLDRGSRKGLSATDMAVGPAAPFTDGTYFDDDTSFTDDPDVVRVEFNGEIIDVVHLCTECLTYLETKA
jgi:hypothetical protein